MIRNCIEDENSAYGLAPNNFHIWIVICKISLKLEISCKIYFTDYRQENQICKASSMVMVFHCYRRPANGFSLLLIEALPSSELAGYPLRIN